MATNEILQFAETDTGTNLLTQAEYLADAQRPIGNQPGVARSKLVNKALRQSSLIAAAVAQFIADNQSNNVVDTADPANIADWIEAAVRSIGIPTAVAGGTADAITADFTPNVALTNGTTVIVRAGAANTTATPTFAPDGLVAKTIVKGNNLALVSGDIAGAGHWLEMNFDMVLDKWVLQNPYNAGIQAASSAETKAGTLTTKAVTPKGLADSMIGGVGQTWQAASRALDTTYTNATGRPIQVAASIKTTGTSGIVSFSINGTVAQQQSVYGWGGSGINGVMGFNLVIPPGSTYSVTSNISAEITKWFELR